MLININIKFSVYTKKKYDSIDLLFLSNHRVAPMKHSRRGWTKLSRRGC